MMISLVSKPQLVSFKNKMFCISNNPFLVPKDLPALNFLKKSLH